MREMVRMVMGCVCFINEYCFFVDWDLVVLCYISVGFWVGVGLIGGGLFIGVL